MLNPAGLEAWAQFRVSALVQPALRCKEARDESCYQYGQAQQDLSESLVAEK